MVASNQVVRVTLSLGSSRMGYYVSYSVDPRTAFVLPAILTLLLLNLGTSRRSTLLLGGYLRKHYLDGEPSITVNHPSR